MGMRGSINLEAYGISDERYRELRYFCYQYQEKKNRIAEIAEAVPGALAQSTPHSGIGDSTQAKVIRMQRYIKDCEDIEQSAIEAAGYGESVLYQHLIRHVTEKNPPSIQDVPCGRNQFYSIRRRFFRYLDQKRDAGAVDL